VARLRPSNLKCVSAVIRYKIVVNIFHYSPSGGRRVTGFLARKTSVVGGITAGGGQGRAAGGEGVKRGGADGDTGLPLPARSLRDGTTKRIAASGAREGPARPPGRGEVPDRRRVVPAPRSYSTNLRIHEDERASERTSERDVFCSRELFLHPPVVGGCRKGSLSISKEHVD